MKKPLTLWALLAGSGVFDESSTFIDRLVKRRERRERTSTNGSKAAARRLRQIAAQETKRK